jgi:superfamily I DNA/RNA helicase
MNAANLEYHFSQNIPKTDTFHLVRANYMGGNIATNLACAGIPFSGLKQYRWTPTERNLFNAIQAIRTFRPLKKTEFCAIVDRYPTRHTGAPNSSSAKEEYKSQIESGERTPTMSTFSQTLIESIKNKNPLELSNIKNKLTIQKITGAMERGWKTIAKEDVDRVKILTIHGSKGMQATTNFLHLGITTAVNKSMLTKTGKENEAYVWYVGVTRTFDNLVIVNYNNTSYPIEGVGV